jgi:16S rRNA G966 N2-methylase RsmD
MSHAAELLADVDRRGFTITAAGDGIVPEGGAKVSESDGCHAATAQLAHIDEARRALALAASIDEVRDIRNKAEAVRIYLQQRGDTLEAQNRAAELKLRAERRLGELLAGTVVPRGNHGPGVNGALPSLPEGVSKKQSCRWQLVASLPEADFERHLEVTKAAGDELTTAGVVRVAATARRQAARKAAANDGALADLPENCTIYHGDFREVMATQIAENSVSLILADPPYAEDAIPLYGDLARLAARVLKPGGSLITYAGQHALPRIMPLMEAHLRYWWLLALEHAGGSGRLPGKWVFVEWKPLLWYVKGGRCDKNYVADLLKSNPPDKVLHDWQQHQKEARYLIERLTQPGDLVLDPVCGSGTVCAAARRLSRRTIGIEIDEERARVARKTVSDAGIEAGPRCGDPALNRADPLDTERDARLMDNTEIVTEELA